jgi:hypothetical protein
MDISLLIITHSEYSDLLVPLFDRFKKHLKINFKSTYVCADILSNNDLINSMYNINGIYNYKDNMSYSDRIKEALININEKYLLIWHDNNILNEDTDTEGFKKIEEFINNNYVDQIRLHAGSCKLPGINIKDDIYKMRNDDHYIYSVYPTIWNKQTLIKLFEKFPDKTYRNIEEIDVQDYVSKLENYYLWNAEKSIPKGCSSELLPHIIKYLHVILRGKWILKWYKDDINKLSNEYNIDLNLRGISDNECNNYRLSSFHNFFKVNHICN